MAKAAKKKQKSGETAPNQRRHNRATKGNNSTNRPCIWDVRLIKDDDGYHKETVEYENKTQWDWSMIYDSVTGQDGVARLIRKKRDKQQPLHEPYNTLLEDWEDGIRAYAMEWNAQIDRIQLDNGWFRYVVFQKNEGEEFVLLTIDSPKNIHFGGRKKFRKKNKENKEK